MEFWILNRFLAEAKRSRQGRTCGYRELINLYLGVSTVKDTPALGKFPGRTRKEKYQQQQGFFGLTLSAGLLMQKWEESGHNHNQIHYNYGCISYCCLMIYGFDAWRSRLFYEKPHVLLLF
jgi:hypothetical protein